MTPRTVTVALTVTLIGVVVLAIAACALALVSSREEKPNYRVVRHHRDIATPVGRMKVLLYTPVDAPGPRPLIVAMPGWAEDGSRQSALHQALAADGFMVAAIPDVIFAAPTAFEIEADRTARSTVPDVSTREAIQNTRRAGEARIVLAVAALSATLDELLADPALAIDRRRIGALGYSFGGAVAAEACNSDPRVRAAFNLDGWLFGKAATGVIRCPYVLVLSRDSLPPKTLSGQVAQDIEAWRLQDIDAHRVISRSTATRIFLARATSHHDLGGAPAAASPFNRPSRAAWNARLHLIGAFFQTTLAQGPPVTMDLPTGDNLESIDLGGLAADQDFRRQ